VISVTISSPETSYVYYTRMPSSVIQYIINPVLSIPIKIGPGLLMNVSVQEYHALNNQIFLMCQILLL
jgi:hypothetical protein